MEITLVTCPISLELSPNSVMISPALLDFETACRVTSELCVTVLETSRIVADICSTAVATEPTLELTCSAAVETLLA